MKDKAYIQWLEERVVRLECELAKADDRYQKSVTNHLIFLDNLTKTL